MAAGIGNGFRLRVPADQNIHTLRIYASIYQGQLKCTATLSDNSAAPYQDVSLNTFGVHNIGKSFHYNFTYKSSSASQSLVITITLQQDLGGNVALSAATLQ
jgi:hypothetical protein